MSGEAIRTEGLTKRFGDVLAVDGLDLSVLPGEIFGFLGPNGAGKTTTIRMLLHLLRPTAGRAWLMGVPADDVEAAHRHLGYLPGEVALWPQLTGREVLTVLGNLSGHVDTAFRDELIERFRLDPDVRTRSYSKGNRQKVALIAAYMTRPDLLLLDEPTAGLDPLMEAQFQQVTRDAAARGQTVFLSSHLLDEVEDLCHRVAILRSGVLVEVSALEDLRPLDASVVEVSADGPLPSLDRVPGVTAVTPVDGGVRISLSGPPGPLLARLAGARITRLRSRQPSLEEIFLTYYEDVTDPAASSRPRHAAGRR